MAQAGLALLFDGTFVAGHAVVGVVAVACQYRHVVVPTHYERTEPYLVFDRRSQWSQIPYQHCFLVYRSLLHALYLHSHSLHCSTGCYTASETAGPRQKLDKSLFGRAEERVEEMSPMVMHQLDYHHVLNSPLYLVIALAAALQMFGGPFYEAMTSDKGNSSSRISSPQIVAYVAVRWFARLNSSASMPAMDWANLPSAKPGMISLRKAPANGQ